MNNKLKNIIYLFLPIIGGIIVGLITSSAIRNETLVNPPLSPSPIVFPIVWTILYLLMGISFYFYKKCDNNNEITETLYYLQLIINYFWSIFFFVFKWYFFSIIWIIIFIIEHKKLT